MMKRDWYLIGTAIVLFYVPFAYLLIFHGWRVAVAILFMFWGNNITERMSYGSLLSRLREDKQGGS